VPLKQWLYPVVLGNIFATFPSDGKKTTLEHTRVFLIPSIWCVAYWATIGVPIGKQRILLIGTDQFFGVQNQQLFIQKKPRFFFFFLFYTFIYPGDAGLMLNLWEAYFLSLLPPKAFIRLQLKFGVLQKVFHRRLASGDVMTPFMFVRLWCNFSSAKNEINLTPLRQNREILTYRYLGHCVVPRIIYSVAPTHFPTSLTSE